MNPIERGVRAVDRFQQRHLVPAFLFAVQKKAGDDNAGTLIANVAYSGFVTVFPLLLITVTVLGIVVGGSATLTRQIENSALSRFPVIGNQLAANIHALHRSSSIGLAIGLLGTVWGATGLAQTAMFAMAEIWNIPGVIRPNFLSRLWRSFAFLGVIALSVIVGGFLSSFSIVGGHGLLGIPSLVASGLVNVGSYVFAFRVLTPPVVHPRQMLPGSIFGGIVWTAIEAVGGYLVTRDLHNASAVYGTFALVLGLLAWIYLAARVAIYAAEINAVLAYRLWPRAIAQPPLTEADRRSLTLQVTENSRRPEQRITVTYDDASRETPAEIRTAPSPAAPYARFLRRRQADGDLGAAPANGEATSAQPANSAEPAGRAEPAHDLGPADRQHESEHVPEGPTGALVRDRQGPPPDPSAERPASPEERPASPDERPEAAGAGRTGPTA